MGDECGASYVAKLEGMCVDALRSRTMVKGFSHAIVHPTLLTRGALAGLSRVYVGATSSPGPGQSRI